MKRTFIPLMLCACFGLLLVACGGSDSNTSNSNTANTTTATSNKGSAANTTSTTNTTSSTTTSSSGDKLGIPECDEYIAKYEACALKAPEAQRAQVKSALEQSRAAWRNLAANPTTKATLPGICKQALESSKSYLKSAGCE